MAARGVHRFAMHIAQITDTHIRPPGKLLMGRVDTARFLADAVAAVNRLDPPVDLVLLTGDLVEKATAEEYAHFAALIASLKAPAFLIPGNHDARDALRQAFPEHRYLPRTGFLQYTLEDWPVRIVALDTLIPGQGGGELCAERIAWCERALAAAPARPTIVMMHHPPFATGILHMDRYGLANREAFAAVVARHPNIERIVAGHLHRSIQARFAGAVATTCPSAAHQIALDLVPGTPLRFVMEPPAIQLHVWSEAAGLVTHTVPVGEFAGPYPYGEPK
jgi:3',5'-cyclic AMP phosphodiesterase CpdA